MPIKTLTLELSERVSPLVAVEGYDGFRILVCYHGQPIGWISITNMGQPIVSAEQLREAITSQCGLDLVSTVIGEQILTEMSGSSSPGPISVVVCTRDRTDHLSLCLKALMALDYPDYEIVVVDNAPSSNDTAQLVTRLPVRYIREERPGLDWARNRGIVEARHSIIAFTDDDVRPHRHWLRAIAQAFAEPDVMAVTGLVAPAELETTAQVLFELGYGGMSHGLRRWTIKRAALIDRDLLWASAFGAGANMAFRREVFTAIGAFDVALDVGTPSGGGGDIEMFHRLVARGYTLVYEPAALVWHVHRRDMASLHQQLYNNGRSFVAYLLTCARNGTVSRLSLLRFVAREWLGRWFLRRLWRPKGFPRRLIVTELAGALTGPLAYRAAQKHAKQLAAAFPEPRNVQPVSLEVLP
jgi:glycosyltransferase involved in cell wall biosynthesis